MKNQKKKEYKFVTRPAIGPGRKQRAGITKKRRKSRYH